MIRSSRDRLFMPGGLAAIFVAISRLVYFLPPFVATSFSVRMMRSVFSGMALSIMTVLFLALWCRWQRKNNDPRIEHVS
jgi:hypothetical protein